MLPFYGRYGVFALLFFKIFLHHLLDFIPLDFGVRRAFALCRPALSEYLNQKDNLPETKGAQNPKVLSAARLSLGFPQDLAPYILKMQVVGLHRACSLCRS